MLFSIEQETYIHYFYFETFGNSVIIREKKYFKNNKIPNEKIIIADLKYLLFERNLQIATEDIPSYIDILNRFQKLRALE